MRKCYLIPKLIDKGNKNTFLLKRRKSISLLVLLKLIQHKKPERHLEMLERLCNQNIMNISLGNLKKKEEEITTNLNSSFLMTI